MQDCTHMAAAERERERAREQQREQEQVFLEPNFGSDFSSFSGHLGCFHALVIVNETYVLLIQFPLIQIPKVFCSNLRSTQHEKYNRG